MADQESTLAPGDVIAEYEIEKVLGSGSFGVTYLARDKHLSRRVAIKEYMPVVYARRGVDGTVSSRNLDTSATFDWGLERFSEEARTLAQFNHPNIVRVLRLIQGLNGTAYIAMELLDGRNLESIVEQEGPLSPPRFLSVFRQLLDGCGSIHRIGILHRDIKPSNIVMCDETPVLIDFGAARDLALQQKAGFSALVTDGFSPLEQYSREIAQTEATDIYALAATAYFLLTGRIPPPSAARSCGETMTPAVEAGAGLVPADVLKGIDWGLALRISERPKSIAEWRAKMPSLDLHPDSGADDRAPRGPGSLSRRGLLLVGGGLVLAGGAGFALLRSGKPLSGSQAPLSLGKISRLTQFSEDPFAGLSLAGQQALVTAYRTGADGNDHLVAFRVDPSGAVAATFELPEPGSRGHAILPAPGGGAFVAGESGSTATLLRLDAAWRLAWSKPLGDGSVTTLLPQARGVVAGLEGAAGSGNAKLMFIDEQGNVGRSVAMTDHGGDTVQGIAPLEGGDFAVLGLRAGAEGSYAWVARRPPVGEIESWRKQLPDLGNSNGWAIAVANRRVYVVGRNRPVGAEEQAYHMFMASLDAETGNVAWVRKYEMRKPASGRALAVTGSGSSSRLYFAGWSGNPPRLWLGQVDGDGDIVWETPDAAGRTKTGGAGLILNTDGTGYALGFEGDEHNNQWLTLQRVS
jgi:hypothetical protein